MFKSKSTEQIFKTALEAAALGDLQFCLRNAERRLAEFEMPAQTIDILRAMRARERALVDVRGTVAMQKESWRLIAQYRSSIPGWCVKGFPWPYRADGRRRWVGHRSATPQRVTRLTAAEVCALLDAPAEVVPETRPVRRPTTARPAALVCPACRVPGLAQSRPDVWTCGSCRSSFQTVRTAAARPARPVASPGTKVCRRCHVEKPVEAFRQGQTIRPICKACIPAYRADLAARRSAVA